MSPVAAPADRRFRRAHLKPGRRRRRWRAVVWSVFKYPAIAAVTVVGVYHGGEAVLRMASFHIDCIVVDGHEHLTRAEILAVLEGMRGEHILKTDLSAWRARVLASSWVDNATLRRRLPSTVQVVVSEKTPIAIGRFDGDLQLIDEHGAFIDRWGPDYAELDLPIVDGLQPARGRPADADRAALAARLIDALEAHPDLARRLSQVDVSDVRNAAVILSGESPLIYLGDERFLDRLQAYLELSGMLKERVPEIDYVDLRFDGRVYVRPMRPVSFGSLGRRSRSSRER